MSVIPLFILMGNFVAHAQMSDELYHAAYCFLGHRRGGLAMSTVVASAGFGAICGSSIATAATFTKVAYPSMRKYGYKDTLAAGSIAAGGTLGILIPPSVIMVIYGIMTETSIGKLFVAGIIPGLDRHRAAVPRGELDHLARSRSRAAGRAAFLAGAP